MGLLYTVPSGGLMSQQSGQQDPSGQESPPRSMSDRSGSKSANNKSAESDTSVNNGYDSRRLNYRESGQHGPSMTPSNGEESSNYHSYINRKADGFLAAGEALSPDAKGGSKLSNHSLSPKSPQMMESDSDEIGDSDQHSHQAGTLISSISLFKFSWTCFSGHFSILSSIVKIG